MTTNRIPARLRRSTILGILLALAFASTVILSCGEDKDENDNTGSGDCLKCHPVIAAAWVNSSSHKDLYSCTYCHEEVKSNPGSGHRASPACDDCHSEGTHLPRFQDPDQPYRLITCLTCHNPHGSTNIFQINERVLVGAGDMNDVAFDNFNGLAVGSFAQPGDLAGTGLCEGCHTTTQFYNRYGVDNAHFTSDCTQCHSHANGFVITP